MTVLHPLSPVRGSSPLTRGKHHHTARGDQQDRLIPAHAGKTAHCDTGHDATRAHPRSRGENKFAPLNADFPLGSSPLTRGKRHSRPHALPWAGLIPAHAGKTFVWCVIFCLLGAHPRSRGENAISRPSIISACGSSPLTRGKRPARIEAFSRRRLIPAHAGKTSFHLRLLRSKRAHPRSRGENCP